MENLLEYTTIGVYLCFLVGIGFIFSRMSKNISDFVRGGAQGTWWMVGTSTLMAGISAFTFTGNAGAAYDAGFSPLIIYIGNCSAYLIAGLFLAKWFRRTRAVTVPDIIRRRFGPEVEQFNVYQSIFLAPFGSAIQLMALALFTSAIFGFPLKITIVVIGTVVVLYSTTGGRWAVMATDFFQSLIMVPITILVAYFCLKEVGGIGGFIDNFSRPDLVDDFKFFHKAGDWPTDRFSPKWMIVIFLSTIFYQMYLTNASRYLSVKDDKEATKSAWLSMVMMGIGALIWFIPPMVARMEFSADVQALTNIDNPSEAAYAVVALKLLPNGLMGILVVAMFAATMSSMDTGLNNLTGSIVKNMIPPLLRLTRIKKMSNKAELLTCKLVTVLLGVLIVTISLALATQKEIQLFDMYLIIGAVVGIPIGIPFLFAMYFRRLPRWSYFWIFGWSMVPTLIAHFDAAVWTIQDRMTWVFIAAFVSAFASMPFYKYSTKEYKDRVDDFFADLNRPIDFEKEVGKGNDYAQLNMMGNVSVAGGLFLSVLLLVPNPIGGRMAVLFVCGTVTLVGALLKWAAAREKRKVKD